MIAGQEKSLYVVELLLADLARLDAYVTVAARQARVNENAICATR